MEIEYETFQGWSHWSIWDYVLDPNCPTLGRVVQVYHSIVQYLPMIVIHNRTMIVVSNYAMLDNILAQVGEIRYIVVQTREHVLPTYLMTRMILLQYSLGDKGINNDVNNNNNEYQK